MSEDEPIVLVCARVIKGKLLLPDNQVGPCDVCGHVVQHRPHAPKPFIRRCVECAIGHYILNPDGTTRPASLLEWARWFEGPDRFLAKYERDGFWVSTVFLGIDHNLRHKGPPLLFETMVFSGDESMRCDRYSTKDDAMIGHEWHVRALNKKIDDAQKMIQGHELFQHKPLKK